MSEVIVDSVAKYWKIIVGFIFGIFSAGVMVATMRRDLSDLKTKQSLCQQQLSTLRETQHTHTADINILQTELRGIGKGIQRLEGSIDMLVRHHLGEGK